MGKQTPFSAMAARADYLAADHSELWFACNEVCRRYGEDLCVLIARFRGDDLVHVDLERGDGVPPPAHRQGALRPGS